MTSTPRTMQAMRAAGQDPASLARQTIPVPEPEPGEVLVAVRATAVTADELTWPESWPAIPCHDLYSHGQLQPGQHVLVHGGAGGVGAYAVQLAAQHGARVTATASARSHDFVAALGADQVLDYTGRFEDHVRDVDIVVDPVGGKTTDRSWPVLRSGGILVAIAEEPDPSHGGRPDVRGVFFVVEPDSGQLRQLARLIDDQQLRPMVSRVFELNDLAEAFRALRGERPPGKVVISVSA